MTENEQATTVDASMSPLDSDLLVIEDNDSHRAINGGKEKGKDKDKDKDKEASKDKTADKDEKKKKPSLGRITKKLPTSTVKSPHTIFQRGNFKICEHAENTNRWRLFSPVCSQVVVPSEMFLGPDWERFFVEGKRQRFSRDLAAEPIRMILVTCGKRTCMIAVSDLNRLKHEVTDQLDTHDMRTTL